MLSHPIRNVRRMDITPQRLTAMRTAIELGVDESDFSFSSLAERAAWQELVHEHDNFCDRDDLVWVAA